MTTADFTLKLICQEDAPMLFQTVDLNREWLHPWLPWVDKTRSVADSLAFACQSERRFRAGEAVVLGIWMNGQLAGCLGLEDIDRQHLNARIGYWLAEDFQGQGIVTRACRMLIGYAFEEAGLQRLEILCATNNYKSRAVPQRLSFIQEGVLRKYHVIQEQFVDIALYSLLRTDGRR
jgi:ribosomal-protein-serine acetyltransferase